MFNEVLRVTLRILLFRAGPQDLPYAKVLTPLIAGLAVLAEFAQYRLTLPTVAALAHGAISIATLAGFTYLVLQSRGLLNRAQQTIHALFLTGSAMTVVLLPPLSALAPHMLRIAQNPELARTEPLPPGPAFLLMILTVWGFMVGAHIYRHALNASLAVGAAVALLAVVVTVPITSGLGLLFGGN